MRRLIILLGTLLVMSTGAMAQSATEMLDAFSKKVQCAKGAYTQTSFDKKSVARTPVTKGDFAFKRPGLFYWNTSEPFAQKIVSDAKKLWLYDPDLAQVTVRDLKGVLGATPAALLFGRQEISSSYVLTELPRDDSHFWVNARPKNEDPSYKSIDIGFDENGILNAMVLYDHFGEKMRYDFSHIELNPEMKATEFSFEIPKGTDVIEDKSQVF